MTWSVIGTVLFDGEAVVAIAATPELAQRIAARMTPAPAPAAYDVPTEILRAWKLQLPVPPTTGGGAVQELEGAALAAYRSDWFDVLAGGALRFRAPTDGATTSGSKYPRSELREMAGPGARASWSIIRGGHHLEIVQAITAQPRGKPDVVAGQIHDGNDDLVVVRLEGRRLIVDVRGKEVALLSGHYVLGQQFAVHFWAGGGRVKVFHYPGGSPPDGWWRAFQPAASFEADVDGCYFKVGCYTQSNCDTEAARGQVCGPDNYAEVVVTSVQLAHT
jgi:hypothetical protein